VVELQFPAPGNKRSLGDPTYAVRGSVMATSDHSMAGSENSENSNKATLTRQKVRLADLIRS